MQSVVFKCRISLLLVNCYLEEKSSTKKLGKIYKNFSEDQNKQSVSDMLAEASTASNKLGPFSANNEFVFMQMLLSTKLGEKFFHDDMMCAEVDKDSSSF